MDTKIDDLKKKVQQIIDFIAAKQFQLAIEKHADASDLLDELIDHTDDDDTLIELSQYQVLLNHLHQKIHGQ